VNYYYQRVCMHVCLCARVSHKNSSGDEIANVNFYAVRQEANGIR